MENSRNCGDDQIKATLSACKGFEKEFSHDFGVTNTCIYISQTITSPRQAEKNPNSVP